MRQSPGKFHKNLAKSVRRLRGNATQTDFGKRLGISHATINRIEQQNQNVTLQLLERFCTVLKVSPNDLLTKDGPSGG